MLKSLILIATLHLIKTQDLCNNTNFALGNLQFNVNHLKNHKPPSQAYDGQTNLYGKEASGSGYVFFNLMDLVHSSKIDGKTILERCQPRSTAYAVSINKPSACIPEASPSTNCIDKKFCWIAIGACDHITAKLIDENDASKGVRVIYEGGDIPVRKHHCLNIS